MKTLHPARPNVPHTARRAAVPGSLLPEPLATQLERLEHSCGFDRDPTTALREAVEGIWMIIAQTASDSALDVSRQGVRALLARRELVQRGTCTLSAVIRRGVESRAFRPQCAAWAIDRLPVAIVAGACMHWVFGVSKQPTLQVGTAVSAALEVLRPRRRRAKAQAHAERSEA